MPILQVNKGRSKPHVHGAKILNYLEVAKNGNTILPVLKEDFSYVGGYDGNEY
jgi:hypothetical protein